jgi:hypothetical protein
VLAVTVNSLPGAAMQNLYHNTNNSIVDGNNTIGKFADMVIRCGDVDFKVKFLVCIFQALYFGQE